MPPTIIAQLIIALGPVALELIPKLAALWGISVLTADQVTELCAPAHKSWDQYRAEALSQFNSVSTAAKTLAKK